MPGSSKKGLLVSIVVVIVESVADILVISDSIFVVVLRPVVVVLWKTTGLVVRKASS